jgi:PRTRC genetic system protein C
MARVFVYDGREFPDPDPNLSVDEIKQMMTDFFPELANAEVKEHQRDQDTLYEFARRVGTKG